MNPKPFLLSQIIHLFQNCLHLKKIVTFPYNFGHNKHFPPKFQIVVVKIGNDLRLISKIQKWQNLVHFWLKNSKLGKILLSVNALRKVLLALPGLDTWQILTGTQNSN